VPGLQDAFITGTGVFLTGDPVANERMEDFIERIAGRSSSIGQRALRWNGIKTRQARRGAAKVLKIGAPLASHSIISLFVRPILGALRRNDHATDSRRHI
jgi:3-oxoacyl-[acyl-carrier-protein] synthase III